MNRATPVRNAASMLEGRKPRGEQPSSPEELRRLIATGRSELRLLTGQDFGYDLLKWHDYLKEFHEDYRELYVLCPEFETQIEELALDPGRQQIVESLEKPPVVLTSEGLAMAIVEALIESKILSKAQGLMQPVSVVRHEIEMRKILGEYCRCVDNREASTVRLG